MNIGGIDRGGLPLVAATISSDQDYSPELIAGVDLIEIRVDMLTAREIPDVVEFFRLIKDKYRKPLIATVRSKAEGGASEISDKRRFAIYSEVVTFSEIIDVEISSPELLKRALELCRKSGRKLMASYHNFKETPPESMLNEIIARGRELGADIVKLAVMANSRADLGNLVRFTVNNRNTGIVTIAMGSVGLASRLMTPLIGSLMTYGYLDSTASPGQMHVSDLVKFLRMLDPEYDKAKGG